jgi:hypothetical protein
MLARPLPGPWRIEGCDENGFAGAVVIPSLAESSTIYATLYSLARNPPELLDRFLVVVVVNHREDAPDSDKSDNLATLELLKNTVTALVPLKLAWVDAASEGCELPHKGGGVGLARRIGLDLALSRLDPLNKNTVLACLDADTLVRPDYLPALMQHFERSSTGGAIFHFLHQPGLSPAGQSAIDRYELFLRSYVFGLKLAGSPYAFHCVGSAMACRASAYLKIGGMNSRSAGEDFYFLQQLSRTVGVGHVQGTVVYPSARASHRVPFGTGRSISRMLDGGSAELLFYQTTCFRILADWLKLVAEGLGAESTLLVKSAGQISPRLAEYLGLIGFHEIWQKLQKNNPGRSALHRAFNGWFDGLKTMKLIHHLSAATYPRCEPEESVPELLQWGGFEKAGGVPDMLEVLRRQQVGKDYPSNT